MKKLLIFSIVTFLLTACENKNKTFDRDKEITVLNSFMDAWHHSAAVADEDVFFGSLDSNAVYLGTDPGERWLKHDFMSWGLKYFERDTAWAFTPYNRKWEFTDNYQYAWFDELLETHMGICRGSGVLKRYHNGWKIKHYNLAVAVPNEKMNDYRRIVNVPIR